MTDTPLDGLIREQTSRRVLEEELAATRRILWHLIDRQGGEVTYSLARLAELPVDVVLEVQTDPAHNAGVIRALR